MSKQPRNYVNGAFLKKNPSFNLINVDFTDAFIDNLTALPKDAKGFRKITLGAQRADPLKWSVFENTFVPGQKPTDNGTDDLPF